MDDAAVVAVYLDGMDLLTIAKTYHMGTRRVQRILREAGVAGELQRRAGFVRRGKASRLHIRDAGIAKIPTKHQWAYIAGFFDGEGSLGAHHATQGTHRRYTLCNNQNDLTPLDWIQRITGVGNVYKAPKGKHAYQLSGQRAIFEFIVGVLPYVIVKRATVEVALQALAQSYRWEV